MATKPFYLIVAVAGIAAASGGAWWYQNQPKSAAATQELVGAVSSVAVPAASAAARPASGAASGPGGGQRPPGVEVAKVESAKLVDDAQSVGSLRSRQSVIVRPEVSGRITQLNFRDGERVRRGQLLVQFDDELQRAQVAQAQAELSIARANHKRNQELVAQNFISQRSVEESAANLQVAQAKLSLAEAGAQRLRILAPFDGIAGIRGVNIGDYLKDGADIVNLEDMDAVYVDFRLPERFQTKLKRGQTAFVNLDALPGRRFTAQVLAIDPLLDANGRSVGVRGCIDNRQMQLRPGMFARVTAVFGERTNARVVPEEALVPQGGRQFVFKLVEGSDPDTRIARRTEVKVGLRQPGKVEIVEGVQLGDVIVTAGQQRIQRDGMAVRVLDLSARAGAPREGGGPPQAPRDGAAAAPREGASGAAVAASGAASAAVPTMVARPLPPATASGRSPGGADLQGRAAGARPAAPTGPNPCAALIAEGASGANPTPQQGARRAAS